MVKEIKLLLRPEDLISWINMKGLSFDLSESDAVLLYGYLEGHDYAIGQDRKGNLFRLDISEENGETVEYTLDEIIDLICDWNYEMILESDSGRKDPKDFIDFTEHQNRYMKLKEDEIRLDQLFDMTGYGKSINKLLGNPSGNVKSNTGPNKSKSIDATIQNVSEDMKCLTGERRR